LVEDNVTRVAGRAQAATEQEKNTSALPAWWLHRVSTTCPQAKLLK